MGTESGDSIARRLESLLLAYTQNHGQLQSDDGCKSVSLLELAFCYSYDAGLTINQALKMAGAPALIPYLKSREEFRVEQNRCILARRGGCMSDKRSPSSGSLAEKCDVSSKCSQRRFTENFGLRKATESTHRLERFSSFSSVKSTGPDDHASLAIAALEKVMGQLCLNVSTIERTDASEKGTASKPDGYAQIVIYLIGLPTGENKKWIPPLLSMVESIVKENVSTLRQEAGIEKTERMQNHLRLSGNRVTLDVYLSSVLLYADALKAMQGVPQNELVYYVPPLLKYQVQFVLKLTKEAKEIVRVLRSWRAQQKWKSATYQPSDTLFEMIVAFVLSRKKKPMELAGRGKTCFIKQAFHVMERFSDIHIAHRDYSLFDQSDVPERFRDMRPLILDATNPYVNLVDPAVFDYSQVVSFAKQTHFAKSSSS